MSYIVKSRIYELRRTIQKIRLDRAQLPYALLAAVLAAVIGFLPAGFGVSPLILLPVGVIILVAIPSLFKRLGIADAD